MELKEAKNRLIVALDVPSIGEAKNLVNQLDGVVSFFKIGIILHITSGLEFIKWLIENDKKVFLDLKFFDIPDTVKEAVKVVANIGVDFLTVHGNEKIIKAAVKGRGESKLKVLGVTLLTSLDAYDIKELGFPCSVPELVLFRAKRALSAGCDGVIASGCETTLIKKEIGPKLLIITPGIRPKDADIDTHKRSTTPTQAIKDGADYLVIGRPIIKAKDPQKASEEIIKEIELAIMGSVIRGRYHT